MSRQVRKAERFIADFDRQFRWYFYGFDETNVEAWRVIHGSRDLPRRLLEPPGFDAD